MITKQSIIILTASILIVAGCKSKSDKAVDDAKTVATELKKMQPGGIPTKPGEWTMTAKIDGKEWSANSIVSPESAGRIVGENNGESISLPYYDQRNFLAATKRKLGDGHDAVDMSLNDDVSLWSAKSGEMEITKVDNNWAEGKFSFTAGGFHSDKTKQVTDGFFRIALKK